MATPTEFSTSSLSDTLVILGAAGIVIPAFARIRINPVIGFILIGILIGPFGLGQLSAHADWLHYVTISNVHAIEPFAEFGIIMLLFSIGLELSFRRLWGMRRLVFGVGAGQLAASAVLIGIAIHFGGYSWTTSFALGVALALSSTAVVLPLVGTTSAVGRSAFAMLLFEDLALVPIVFALGALDPRTQEGVGALVQTLGVGAAVIAAMLVLGRFLLPPLFAQAARTKSPELFLSASLLIVIAASLATTAAGLSPIVGALVAGILIAETDYHGEVEVMMAPFRGLGLGIFLITVGMSVNLEFIAGHWPQLLMALVGVMVAKTVVTAICLRWWGGRRRAVAAEASLLMASPSETTLIVLGTAGTAGLISAQTAAFWQVVTAMGLTLTPLLARIGRDAGVRIEKRVAGGEPAIAPTREEPRAVIIGFGRVGRLVAEMLAEHGKPFVAVDSNIDAVKAARAQNFPIVFGDAARPEFLDKLNLGHASALILTMDDPVQAIRTVKRVRAWCPDLTIVARARDTHHAAELYKVGVTDAVPETLESSLQLSEAVLVDLGMAMGPVIASIHEKRAAMRHQIMKMGALQAEPTPRGKRLRDALER